MKFGLRLLASRLIIVFTCLAVRMGMCSLVFRKLEDALRIFSVMVILLADDYCYRCKLLDPIFVIGFLVSMIPDLECLCKDSTDRS